MRAILGSYDSELAPAEHSPQLTRRMREAEDLVQKVHAHSSEVEVSVRWGRGTPRGAAHAWLPGLLCAVGRFPAARGPPWGASARGGPPAVLALPHGSFCPPARCPVTCPQPGWPSWRLQGPMFR